MVHERVHHVRRDRLDAPAQLSRVVRDEVADEERDVLGPLAKGRQLNRENVQPVVEVGAKRSRVDQLLQRTIRRGDDPDVTPNRLRAAEPLEFLLLQHPEQLRL